MKGDSRLKTKPEHVGDWFQMSKSSGKYFQRGRAVLKLQSFNQLFVRLKAP